MSGASQPTTGAADDGTATLIGRKLRRAWRKERRLRHSRGLCFLLVWVVALILLDLLVDWLFLASYRVPWYGRTALLVINVVTLVVVLYHYWLRHLRRYSPVRVALQVEGKHPELKSLLVSYVQIDERHRRETYASPFLVEAFKRQAIEVSTTLNFREIVSFKELKKLFLFSVCVVAFFGAISAYKSDFFGTLLRRMLNPALAEEYPTSTVIDETKMTGNVVRPQGAKLTLAAECWGVIPDEGQLRLRAEGGSWETLPLLKQTGSLFTYEFVNLLQSFDYFVRLGDDRSQIYHVEVIPPPKVIEKKITLTYPPYTGLKPRTQKSYYVEALEGTKVLWWARTDRPLERANIWKNQVRGPAMKISGDGHIAEGSLDAPATFEYQFNWKLADYGFFFRSPGRYVVNVIPDADPEVEISSPTRDEKATVRKTLRVAFRATDDYGLSTAYLVYKVNEGRENRVKIASLSGRQQEKAMSRKLSSLVRGLKENDLVAYYIEVVDNCTGRGGRNIGRSQVRRVFLVSVPEYLRSVLEEHQRWLTEVASLRTEEMKASHEVGVMKVEEVGPIPGPATMPASRPAK